MSSNNFAVADQSSESFPNYAPKIHESYIDGYDPVSLGAHHSSLERSSTWIGMGLTLTSLAGFGILIWVAATSLWGQGVAPSEYNLTMFFWIGLAIAAVLLVGGFGLIWHGRRFYREYRDSTGRRN